MGDVRKSHHIAGVLQNDVLEPTAGSEQRFAVFAREPNAGQCAFQTFVRTSRRAQESIKLCEIMRCIGGEPLTGMWDTEGCCYMTKSSIRQ